METKEYIYFLCDLLTIDFPNVHIKENGKYINLHGDEIPPFPAKDTAMATAYPKENKILVNMDAFHDGLEYIVIAHEMRHIYQWAAVQEKLESKRIIKLWEDNFKHYLDSSNDGYENQPLEIDANAFAYIIIKTLFDREITVRCDAKRLNKRIKELLIDFSREEIIESYTYSKLQAS